MNETNLPKDLQDSKSTPLNIDPTDPTTAKLVKEFVAQKEGEEAPPLEINEEGATTKPRVNIPPDRTFDGGDETQAIISEAFVPTKDIACTDMEKELFLKAVLTDSPIRLPIMFYNGKLKIEIRSRTVHEQRRCFDAVEMDKKDGLFGAEDLAMAVTRLHYYLAALMVERYDGQLFSELTIPTGNPVTDDVQKMRKFVTEKLEGMNQLKWSTILNALRIFEHKCSRLNTEAANEDFWKPHGSA
jgi:hypothetical protein